MVVIYLSLHQLVPCPHEVWVASEVVPLSRRARRMLLLCVPGGIQRESTD